MVPIQALSPDMMNDRDPLIFSRVLKAETYSRILVIPYPLIRFLEFTPGEPGIFMADHDKEGKIVSFWNKASTKTDVATRTTFEVDFWNARTNGLTFPPELARYLDLPTKGKVYLQARNGKLGRFVAIWDEDYEKKRVKSESGQ